MLLNEACPGWLYEVKHGATTVWEGWNTVEENGKINTFSMNHYSPGAAMSWLFSRCAGIRPEAPGFKKIRIQPYPGGGLTYVSATYKSVSGEIFSAWEVQGDVFNLTVTIPEGTEARIVLPDGSEHNRKGGTYQFHVEMKVNM